MAACGGRIGAMHITHLYHFLQTDLIVVTSRRKRADGCGSVDSVVASDTRDPEFECNPHRQLLLNNYLMFSICRKDKNK